MEIKLLALDLDGTTLDRNLLISDANRASIQRVIEKNVTVAIITGKMFAASLPIAKRLNAGIRYLLASNGAHVYDIRTNTELVSYPLDPVDTQDVVQILESCGVDFRIYSRDAMFAVKESRLVESIRKSYPDLPVFIGKLPANERYYKIYAEADDQTLTALIPKLKSLPVQVHPSDANNVEITNRMANKGEALRFLKRYLKIETCQVLAIGNHDNDLPMFAEAGYSVAVQNAPLYVQQKANFVTKHCEEDGVAYALNQLFD